MDSFHTVSLSLAVVLYLIKRAPESAKMSVLLNGQLGDFLLLKTGLSNMEFSTARILLSAAVLYILYHIANVRDISLGGTPVH